MKSYIKRNKGYFILLSACCASSALFAVAVQFLKGEVLDLALTGALSRTGIFVLFLLSAILLEVLLFYGYDCASSRFIASCARNLRFDLMHGVLAQTYPAFLAEGKSACLAKFTNDAELVRSLYFSVLPQFAEILSKILLVSGALFLLSWRMALLTLFLLTTPLYVPKLIEKRLKTAQNAYKESVTHHLSRIAGWLSVFETVKNFRAEHRVLKQYQQVNDALAAADRKNRELANVSRLISTLLSYLSHFLVLAAAALLVAVGTFSAGDFFIAVGLIDQLSWPLIALSELVRSVVSVKPVCEGLHAVLNASEEKQVKPSDSVLSEGILYDGVYFSYEKAHPLLEDFHMEIRRNESVLFRGTSGCGKTTAINLLMRYIEPDSGMITIDGRPLSSYDDLYGLVTLMRQDTALFRDSLRNNLTMYEDYPDEELFSVLRQVGLSGYASREALEMAVTEDGGNFSGGERRRLCLARALLHKSDVLVLDEPLANLDQATAAQIEDVLLKLENRTLLIVSHSFSEQKLDRLDRVFDLTETDRIAP